MRINLRTSLTIDTIQQAAHNEKKEFRYTKEERMETLTLKEITYYLIQLFYKTGKMYSCTQTKLGKLLSILAFSYARRGRVAFEEKIYAYPGRCGTLIKDLTFIPQTIYLRDWNAEDPDGEEQILEDLNEAADVPEEYNIRLTLEAEADIRDVFRNFGAYSGEQLAKCLNPIVDKIKVGDSDNLDLECLQSLDRSSFGDSEQNPVINYIFS